MTNLRIPLDEREAASILFQHRWGDDWVCAACGHRGCTQLRGRPRIVECNACGHQASVTAGTALHGCHVPLVKVVRAAILLSQPGSISSRRLAKEIGVSRETAWSLGHRLRTGFLRQTEQLRGEVVLSQASFHRRLKPGQEDPTKPPPHRSRRPGPPRRRKNMTERPLPTRFQILRDQERRMVVLPGGKEHHALRRFVDAHSDVGKPLLHHFLLVPDPGKIGNGVHHGVSDRWMPLYACSIAGWHNARIRGADPAAVTLTRALSTPTFPFARLRPKEASQHISFQDWEQYDRACATVLRWQEGEPA